MPKFRKIPVVIEAMQLKATDIYEVYSFINGEPDLSTRIASEKWDDYLNVVLKNGLKIKTLESDGETQVADINDWIIKGVKGEFYPCKPDIFEMTYEPA